MNLATSKDFVKKPRNGWRESVQLGTCIVNFCVLIPPNFEGVEELQQPALGPKTWISMEMVGLALTEVANMTLVLDLVLKMDG